MKAKRELRVTRRQAPVDGRAPDGDVSAVLRPSFDRLAVKQAAGQARPTSVDVLIPTYNRPTALAMMLTSLSGQTFRDFRVVVSDQTENCDVAGLGEVQAAVRVLQVHGHPVEIHKHLPRRGMAEQRHFLLDQVTAPYALFLDDDLILEPYVIGRMVDTLWEERCGFVGSAVIGLSYVNDVRPHEQKIEFWQGRVQPETVEPDTPEWERWRLHNACNIYHIQERFGITPEKPRRYKVAWVGACVMYDTARLREVGGYSFWSELPAEHAGEDVLAQLRVMKKYGGCGIVPSGVYHMELPTTVVDRLVDAPRVLPIERGMSDGGQ
jgi:GT2 family glycosyltransferase